MTTRSRTRPIPRLLRIAALFAFGFGTSAANADAPDSFPDIRTESARPLLVVASVRPGAYLPQFPECSKPDTLCMDPPPFWFKAKIDSVVYGGRVPARLNVATASHYGMSRWADFGAQRFLVSLLTDGRDFIMPRYAMAELTEDNAGNLHLIVLHKQPIWWLPCSAWALRTEISAKDFPATLEIPEQESDYYTDDVPELFRRTGSGIVPRFAIPIAQLATHLRAISPESLKAGCRQDSPD